MFPPRPCHLAPHPPYPARKPRSAEIFLHFFFHLLLAARTQLLQLGGTQPPARWRLPASRRGLPRGDLGEFIFFFPTSPDRCSCKRLNVANCRRVILLEPSLEEVGPQRVVPDAPVRVQWWISRVAEVQTGRNMLQTIYESESCFSSDGVSGREQLLAQQRMHSMISSGKRQLPTLDFSGWPGKYSPGATRKHPSFKEVTLFLWALCKLLLNNYLYGTMLESSCCFCGEFVSFGLLLSSQSKTLTTEI